MNVAERIKQLRESRKMTKTRLAQLAGVSQSYISDIEAGKKNPTLEVISRICDALGVTVIELLSEEITTPEIDPESMRLAKLAEKLDPGERKALMRYLEETLKRKERN